MEKPDVNALAEQMVVAVKNYVAQAEARIQQSVDAKLAEASLAKQAAAVESLERRASRHADHLGALETRVQALEHGGKK